MNILAEVSRNVNAQRGEKSRIMAFKRKKKVKATYTDPEALFRDRRKRSVQGLLSHQSDILRLYHQEAFTDENVALELPTGSGKTLVGLLIAEFRRTTLNERVVYLCPTKQLVLQVCEQSERKYGITATPFVGSNRDYAPNSKAMYQNASTIAVTTYSSLFNTNPFFKSPNLIILDDAHASENYVAAAWSLDVKRDKHSTVYFGILDLLASHIPPLELQRFRASVREDRWVQLAATSDFVSQIGDLEAFLDEHTSKSKLKYPWSFLRGHLDSCHVYMSYDSILIRPYIPPSLTHSAFAGASQRIFMSATLGLGGDLERITGIPTLKRLPIPDGWDKQGIGRRYFSFPEMTLENDAIGPLVKELVDVAGRALILVPSDSRAEKYEDAFDAGVAEFSAEDIEESKDIFVAKERAVAVLANRYDGIDLSEAECRLLIVDGLPKAGNLQERFLLSQMASASLLSDRIRTRIIQAVGRCTRSATDYAAVVVIGEDFNDWLVLNEKRSLFHPELQGELMFGAEQSAELTHQGHVENLEVFLAHDSEWDDVDADILEYRDEAKQTSISGQDKMFEVSSLEVQFQYAMWDQNYSLGLQVAERITGCLSGDSIRGFRGWWYYQSATAAFLSANQLGEAALRSKAKDLYTRASACVPAISWLRKLAGRLGTQEPETSTTVDELFEWNIERIEMLFDQKSYSLAPKFERDAQQILAGIDSDDDSDAFEEAQRRLGELLGFDAGNSNADATPDPWWISDGQVCLVFEDKNDSKPETPVSVKQIRQAASHPDWIRAHIALSANAVVDAVLVTPAKTIHHEVPTFAGEVAYWHIDDFRIWAREAIEGARSIRSSFTGSGNIEWREVVQREFSERGLDPRSIIKTALGQLVKDVEVG